MQVDFDPTRSGSHVLPVVLRPPALDERHPNSAHLRQLVDRFEAVVHALREQLRELSVVKDFQRASRWNLTDGRRMEAMMMIAVATLDEDRRVRQTLRVDLPTNVVQMHAFTYVTPRVLYGRIPVHVAELAQAEPVAVVRGIREAVHDDRVGVTVEDLADSTVEFVVRNRGPI